VNATPTDGSRLGIFTQRLEKVVISVAPSWRVKQRWHYPACWTQPIR